MDASRYVNNVIYSTYFESARIVYFEKLAVQEYGLAQDAGIIFGATICTYKFPFTYPDILKIGTRTSYIEAGRFNQEYIVYSPSHQRVVGIGTDVIIQYDYDQGKISYIPEYVCKWVASIETEAYCPLNLRQLGIYNYNFILTRGFNYEA